jgi:hypothetical protein
MRFLVLLSVYLALAPFTSAHVPVLVEQDSLEDIHVIEDYNLSQAFYGELDNFPHTFEIRATEPFTLFTKILQPDIESSDGNVSGIIIKLPAERGRVEEVARLSEKGTWPTEYEIFGGDSYRTGPSFERELGPGTYRIEVSTPDNIEKYVLVVGKREELTIGYFELVGRIAEVKAFFGKSKLRVVESVYVYVPILLVASVVGYLWYRRRRGQPTP